MTDAEYSQGTYNGFTDTSWQDRYGTAGRRHKLFALVCSADGVQLESPGCQWPAAFRKT